MNKTERNNKDDYKKTDKYGVKLDSKEYLDLASIASNTDYTGFVPVAILTNEEKENYEETFDVPVGKSDNKEELFTKERREEIRAEKTR